MKSILAFFLSVFTIGILYGRAMKVQTNQVIEWEFHSNFESLNLIKR